MTEPVASPPRRFALLGPSGTSMIAAACRAAIESSEDHAIVLAALANHPGVRTLPDWQSLIDHQAEYDAILVSGDPNDFAEAISRLAVHGLPLVIPVELNFPAELVAELNLYDAEGVSRLIPLLAFRRNPLVQQLREIMSAGRLGEIVRIESRVELKLSSPATWTDRPVENHLLAEIDILRRLGGDYSQVNLIRTGVRDDRFAMQTLTLTGAGLPDAVSLLDASANSDSFRVRVEGTNATAALQYLTTQGVLTIDDETIAKTEHQAPTERLLELIDDAALGRSGAPKWHDVARAFEIMEAAQRSLRRRRTIDLHFETTSERSQFKTHMAAIGCGVILWTMFGVIGLLFAGAVLDPRDRMQREAEAAGFVLRANEFLPDSEHLTGDGVAHVKEIARQLKLADSVVIVEPVDRGPEGVGLDALRERHVRETLADTGGEVTEDRIVVRPLKGEWFARAMTGGRVIVFGPLGVYLLLQLLLVIAKPAARREAASLTSGEP